MQSIRLLGSLFIFVLTCLWPQLKLTDGMSRAGTFCVIWLVKFIAAISDVFGVFPISVVHSPKNILISASLLSVVVASLPCVAFFYRAYTAALVRKAHSVVAECHARVPEVARSGDGTGTGARCCWRSRARAILFWIWHRIDIRLPERCVR